VAEADRVSGCSEVEEAVGAVSLGIRKRIWRRRDSIPPAPQDAPDALKGIDHIVVLMMENRSFDHFLGSLKMEDPSSSVVGLDGTESNPDGFNPPVSVFRIPEVTVDPPHDWDESHRQWNQGANNGFVSEQRAKFPGQPTAAREAMGYHTRDQLPVLYWLADHYTVCNNWFSSVMGPTWPNRFYLHCGTSNGERKNERHPELRSIWNELHDRNISAVNYYSDMAWVWGGLLRVSITDHIDKFFKAAKNGKLPAFSIVDPGYLTNSDHPAQDIGLGQALIASVYRALVDSPQWERTVLVITYDEHGGLYDHVPPPRTTDDDPEFCQLGFRVPALVIGPQVKRGHVENQIFDHVTPLATATRRFGLNNLNERVAATADLSSCIDPTLAKHPVSHADFPVTTLSRSEKRRRAETAIRDYASAAMARQTPDERDFQWEILRELRSRDVKLPLRYDRRGKASRVIDRELKRANKLGVTARAD